MSLFVTPQIEKALLYYLLHDKQHHVAIPRSYVTGNETDVLSITKAGYIHEYELKISRSDFKADAKKSKFRRYIHQVASVNYFYYVYPTGLLKEEEIPNFAGIIEVHATETKIYFKEVRKPVRIGKQKCSFRLMRSITRCLAFRVAGITETVT